MPLSRILITFKLLGIVGSFCAIYLNICGGNCWLSGYHLSKGGIFGRSLYSTVVEWWVRVHFVVGLLRIDRAMRFSNWYMDLSIISR